MNQTEEMPTGAKVFIAFKSALFIIIFFEITTKLKCAKWTHGAQKTALQLNMAVILLRLPLPLRPLAIDRLCNKTLNCVRLSYPTFDA